MGKIFSEGLIMRRAVITGLGIVSSIGNNKDEVTTSLREGRSGITFSEEFEQAGMRSQVWGKVNLDIKEHITFYGRSGWLCLYCDATSD